MKTYIEATEVVEGFEVIPEFIRSDITDMTDTEIQAVKDVMKDIMTGKNYILQRHFCRHDESGSCEMIEE